ncbi:MAG TPA: pyridoxamine 5'-phosphate oxidase family protein [Kiloniellaceae bacterium]
MALTNLDIWHSEDEPRLGAVLGECWHLLCDGAADPQHDFHLAALATQHAGFGCALRTVVLRKVDSEARELWFYTDLRSRKIGEIQDDPRIALLFHSLSDDTQLRVQAEATIHHSDALAEAAWRALKPRQRRDYLVSGPRGLPWAWATSGLPAAFENRDPSVTESEAGRLNFAVVVCRMRQMDWLFLTPYGHRRASFAWTAEGRLQTSWLVP